MAKNPTPAQLKALKDSKGVKSTVAITKPGQKATGLAKSTVKDRFASTAKTPVKKATSGFSGSGTPLGASMGVNPLNKGQIANAALTATLLPGSGQVRKYLGAKAGGRVTEAAFKASTKGFNSSGMGGRIYTAGGLEGKVIASTKVGSAAEGAAKMNNLEIAKIKEAVRAGSDIGNQVIRGVNQAGKVVRATTVAGVVGKSVANKTKKKK